MNVYYWVIILTAFDPSNVEESKFTQEKIVASQAVCYEALERVKKSFAEKVQEERFKHLSYDAVCERRTRGGAQIEEF